MCIFSASFSIQFCWARVDVIHLITRFVNAHMRSLPHAFLFRFFFFFVLLRLLFFFFTNSFFTVSIWKSNELVRTKDETTRTLLTAKTKYPRSYFLLLCAHAYAVTSIVKCPLRTQTLNVITPTIEVNGKKMFLSMLGLLRYRNSFSHNFRHTIFLFLGRLLRLFSSNFHTIYCNLNLIFHCARFSLAIHYYVFEGLFLFSLICIGFFLRFYVAQFHSVLYSFHSLLVCFRTCVLHAFDWRKQNLKTNKKNIQNEANDKKSLFYGHQIQFPHTIYSTHFQFSFR